MPELPDIEVYLDALRRRVVGDSLQGVRLTSMFVLRTVEPPLAAVHGRKVTGLARLGKRIVLELDGAFFLVLHLMIAGRLRWREPGARPPGKIGLAAFDFTRGTLLLTEASKRKRAALHVVRGAAGLTAHDPGGLEVLDADFERFAAVLRSERHTVKRALTDPHLFSGIGNAYSDEILHKARLSPFKRTDGMSDDEIRSLYQATCDTLRHWVRVLREEAGDDFPEKVTTFREGMAVHGRYRRPCPECDGPVQRIVYAENEANYCPACQTGGKLLSDRALARLLGKDWPRTVEELESRRRE